MKGTARSTPNRTSKGRLKKGVNVKMLGNRNARKGK